MRNFGPLVRCLQCNQAVSRRRPEDKAEDATLYVPEPEVR
jgi:hypothetical protein